MLKPCPCGTIPSNLVVGPIDGSKWARVSGSCCGEWEIEFRTNYERDLVGLMPLAVAAWNSAPRPVEDSLREELRLCRQEVANLKAAGEARTVSGPTAKELWEWVFAGILQKQDYHDHGSQFHIDCENLNAMMKEGGDG